MWVKKGLVYFPSGQNGFDFSHCHKPTPLVLNDCTVRVYFGVRDEKSITRTTFIDLNYSDLNSLKVSYVHSKPVLDIGKIGTFDDSGANVSSVLRVGDLIYMYHIGWNPSTTVHTRNSIGLSISKDGGTTFDRPFDGSVLDRNHFEPYYTGAVDVKYEKGIFKVWYTSGKEWVFVNGKPEISYHIKYGESSDGIIWKRDNIFCLKTMDPYEVTARPSVFFEDGKYKMWYSKRYINDFRTDSKKGYRGGFADSLDGIKWERKDDMFGIKPSSDGWDSQAIAYPYVIRLKDRLVMFYNGNGFGKTGFGYAVFEG